MDFVQIKVKQVKKNVLEVYPEFCVGKRSDLMIKGKDFYAVWNDEAGLWSTDEYDIVTMVDNELRRVAEEKFSSFDGLVKVKYMSEYSSGSWNSYLKYKNGLPDNFKQLDTKVCFQSMEVKKKDYISRRLPYDLSSKEPKAWNKLISVLYDEENRQKIEWAIGSIIAGESKNIQKFIVFFGEPGTGKSTVLDIIQKLFDGYYTVFEAKALTSSNNLFATEAFRKNPLLAIQHDGDLSKIEDNSKLNSIVSHEVLLINEKRKTQYPLKLNCFLMMASNKPVKITDAKAGMIRRLIDIRPTGNKVSYSDYCSLMEEIEYELGSIANHCLQVFNELGKSYYNPYRPVDMMYRTDPFFNFVEDSYLEFMNEEFWTAKQAYTMYKKYCEETNAKYKDAYYIFRENLKDYFKEYYDQYIATDGKHYRSVYVGFLKEKFERKSEVKKEDKPGSWIELKENISSLLDEELKDCPAQYATKAETPKKKWVDVETTLKELDTTKLHYVKVPENHIVIDFDIREDGKKSLKKNIEAASTWPKTYVETSKSGNGLHLHYIYTGDVSQLSRICTDEIEIKVFTGGASLRRKLVKCNDIPIASISSGLPLREVKKMVGENVIKNQEHLRSLIIKALKKQVGSGHTKPSIDYINKCLEEAYASGMTYDMTDLRNDIYVFASRSSNQKEYCLKIAANMKFKSDDEIVGTDVGTEDLPLAMYDCEVYPNLFLLCYKKYGKGNKVERLYNPKPEDVKLIFKSFRMVGFNNRRYDNHICYAAMNGYSNKQLFNLSQQIINGSSNAFFGEAYNLAYADIYEISSKKQSLKKFEVELGITHKEMEFDWDKPLPEMYWELVGDYCENDVLATEAVWDDRKEDVVARQILAKMSGLSVSDTTRMHAQKIIFGDDKHPELNYVDLSKEFPGYEFKDGHSSYRGEDPGEGGYVYAEPGMYGNVALLDIASMHPSTAIAIKYFGKYTERFKELKESRIAIKHKDYDRLKTMLDGLLVPFLSEDDGEMKSLAYSLKIVINMIYGFTTALFDNVFKDPRNKDNIIAKRGALFMINLKHEVQNRGFTVAHIKTDSIKIPDATPEIIKFVTDYGKKYGYDFEHEATYEKLCLVNDAVYIAKDKNDGHWTATGTQFQIPYVFKKCFTKEDIVFEDLCETKQVSTALYIDMSKEHDQSNLIFVGKVGKFCPMKTLGGVLLRKANDKYNAATGSKGYLWMESDIVKANHYEYDIDMSYYETLANNAIDTINQYGDYYWFASDDPYMEEVPFSGARIV
ncbi:MAG: hypothetical protein J6U54_13280 [Clostridiales bacterium]|nr:hypothetical protein [Clostridiales bacterium]